MLNSQDQQGGANHSRWPVLHEKFGEIAAGQVSAFRKIGSKCDKLQRLIETLQASVSLFEDKQRLFYEDLQSQKIRDLKDKQNDFIISSLKQKIDRLTQSQEHLQSESDQKQRKLISLEMQLEQEKSRNFQLCHEIQMRKDQAKRLIQANNLLKTEQIKNSKEVVQESLPSFHFTYGKNEAMNATNKEDTGLSNDEYDILQAKMREIEDQFNSEMENEKTKNKRLQKRIKQISIQLQEQSYAKKNAYQLQLKLTNVTNEYKELQQSFTSILNQNNDCQIEFHKSTLEYKKTIQKEKKALKNYKTQTESLLKNFAANLLGKNQISTIFIGVKGLSDQFEEVKKILLKSEKRNSQQKAMEKDIEIQTLQLKLQKKQKQVYYLCEENQKLKNYKTEKAEKTQKQFLMKSNSLTGNKSQRSQNRSNQSIKEKDRVKVEQLVQKIQEQQKTINKLRKNYDEKETELNRKFMQLEAEIARKQLEVKLLRQKIEKEQQKNQNIREEHALVTIGNHDGLKDLKKQYEMEKNEYQQKAKAVLSEKNREILDVQRKLKSSEERLERHAQKNKRKEQEYTKIIGLKEKSISELIAKNKSANIEILLLNQKISIFQASQDQDQIEQKNELLQARQQLIRFKDIQRELRREINCLEQQNSQLTEQNTVIKQIMEKRKEKDNQHQLNASELMSKNQQISLKYKVLQNQYQAIKKSNQNYKQILSKNSSEESFSKLKEEYEKKVTNFKSQLEQKLHEYKKLQKQYEEKIKRLQTELQKQIKINMTLSAQMKKVEKDLNGVISEQKQRNRQSVSKLETRIEELNVKNQNKQVNVQLKANPNPANNNNKQFKKTDSFQLAHIGTMTQNPLRKEIAVNTIDLFEAQLNCNQNSQPLVMNNILDEEYLALRDEQDRDDMAQIMIQQQSQICQAAKQGQKRESKKCEINKDLNADDNLDLNADEMFQICDSEEQVNFVESSANLQIREVFVHLRREIQKIFNQEEASMAVVKLLPIALQDDFFELTAYVKDKISRIRMQNDISFIMAEPGDRPESVDDNSLELPELIDRRGSEGDLKKIIQEKQAFIHSLMNDKVSQENTINQLTMEKQEMEDENENKFMNQCNIYKKQIKDHKKQIDVFQMNFQSLVNIVKNVLEIYSDDQEQEDDFRDNMTMLARIAKLNERDRSRINYYIHKYVASKSPK